MQGSYFSRLGTGGVMRVVWHAIPWYLRWAVFPFYLSVYSRIFSECTNIDEVRVRHIELYYQSKCFKLCRPRFRLIKRALLPLDVKHEDLAIPKAISHVHPVAWEPSHNASDNQPVSV